MTALGVVLLLLGLGLVIAEAHVPGGILGATGALALVIGAVLTIAALGGGALVAVAAGVGVGATAAGWAVLVTRKTASAQHLRIRSGAEGLTGRVGVVRRWDDPAGQVLVDGALWRARREWPEDDEGGALHEGDTIVVERVSGLTLSVRRAEEWELFA